MSVFKDSTFCKNLGYVDTDSCEDRTTRNKFISVKPKARYRFYAVTVQACARVSAHTQTHTPMS